MTEHDDDQTSVDDTSSKAGDWDSIDDADEAEASTSDDETAAAEPDSDSEPLDVAPVPEKSLPVGFSDVADRFWKLLGPANGPLFFLWFCVAGVYLLTTLASNYLRVAFNDSAVVLPSTIAIAALSTVALFATTAAIYAVDANDGDLTLGRAIEISIEHLIPVTVVGTVFHVTVWASSMCFLIPGLVAVFFLYAAPFLAATKGTGLMESIDDSVALAKKHYVIGMLSIALGFGVGVILGLLGYLGFMALDVYSDGSFSNTLESGSMFLVFLVWGVTAFFGYFGWLWTGAVLSSIAEREGIQAPAKVTEARYQ